MNVKITPYHLFCIIKQYGENIELFHPDIKNKMIIILLQMVLFILI